MENINECLMHYNKLLRLLEDDFINIESSFQGDLMDAYRLMVKKEINEIQSGINTLKRLVK